MPGMPNPRVVGEIWDVVLSPVVGHERGGMRPVLVVSNDDYNKTPHGLYIVAPITGTFRNVPSQLPVRPPEGGLTKPSVLLCEQVRAASVLRFRRRRGTISEESLAAAQTVVAIFIDQVTMR